MIDLFCSSSGSRWWNFITYKIHFHFHENDGSYVPVKTCRFILSLKICLKKNVFSTQFFFSTHFFFRKRDFENNLLFSGCFSKRRSLTCTKNTFPHMKTPFLLQKTLKFIDLKILAKKRIFYFENRPFKSVILDSHSNKLSFLW